MSNQVIIKSPWSNKQIGIWTKKRYNSSPKSRTSYLIQKYHISV